MLPVLILRSLILLSMLVVHHKAAVYTGHRQHTALFHMGHSQMIELQCSFDWSQERKSRLVGSQNKSKQGKSCVRFWGVGVHRNFQLVTFQTHKCHCYGWMKVEAIAVFLLFLFQFLLWKKSFPLGKCILILCDSYIYNLWYIFQFLSLRTLRTTLRRICITKSLYPTQCFHCFNLISHVWHNTHGEMRNGS